MNTATATATTAASIATTARGRERIGRRPGALVTNDAWA
jgi:hypothetical protein